MTIERYNKIVDVLNFRQEGFTVLMEGVHKIHNYAAILRSCDAFGVPMVHAVPNTALRVNIKKAKSQLDKLESGAGAAKWVDVCVHDGIAQAYASLKNKGYQLIVAHCDETKKTQDFRDVDFTKKSCIVMGTEKFGPTDYALEHADIYAKIPMVGMVESFNVSVAASLFLSESYRQRQNAGMLKSKELTHDNIVADKSMYNKLFEGLYPKAAKKLRRLNQPYPLVDHEGELVIT